MRYIAILNPAAGHGKAGQKQATVEAALQEAGLQAAVWLTERPGHAVALARKAAAQADAVLAVGGDGTIRDVAQGLVESRHDALLGVLPLGTGNDFVKMLGIPLHPRPAARLLATATPRPVDYGLVRCDQGASHVFVNAVGVGFDAQVAVEAASFKFLPGFTGYLAAVFRTLLTWNSPRVRIEAIEANSDAVSVLYQGRLLLVTVGNGISSGGMFRLTPRASITDGWLDVCLAEHATRRRIVQVIPRTIRGRHEMERDVHTYRVRWLGLTAEQEVPVHADGEILAENARKITIKVVPGGLSVLMPS